MKRGEVIYSPSQINRLAEKRGVISLRFRLSLSLWSLGVDDHDGFSTGAILITLVLGTEGLDGCLLLKILILLSCLDCCMYVELMLIYLYSYLSPPSLTAPESPWILFGKPIIIWCMDVGKIWEQVWDYVRTSKCSESHSHYQNKVNICSLQREWHDSTGYRNLPGHVVIIYSFFSQTSFSSLPTLNHSQHH